MVKEFAQPFIKGNEFFCRKDCSYYRSQVQLHVYGRFSPAQLLTPWLDLAKLSTAPAYDHLQEHC